jgi:hypothetical protein
MDHQQRLPPRTDGPSAHRRGAPHHLRAHRKIDRGTATRSHSQLHAKDIGKDEYACSKVEEFIHNCSLEINDHKYRIKEY